MVEVTELTKPTGKETLIAGFISARRDVFQAIVGLERDDFERPINKAGTTIREMLAHWIEWDKFEIERAGKFLDGKEVDFRPDEDNDSFNEIAFEKWKDSSVGELLVEFRACTDNVRMYLSSLSEEDLFKDIGFRFNSKVNGEVEEHVVTPAWMLVENDHDRNHAKEIEVWKKEVGISGYLQTT